MTEVWALPGYDVQGLIGFGATGEVWRAVELATGEAVALKRLRDGGDPDALTALRREAAVLRSLDTPYVVRLRAVLGEGPDTVLVLDLATGGSLAALLARRGSMDPGEVVTIAAPLAQALAAAHDCGLVHGDVTPSNVLFTADGMPLLADLGLARWAGEPGGAVDGTAEYVDPVVAAGGRPDAASDVWGLAAVCHHLLSGTPPHDGASADEVLDAARAGSRAPLGLLAPAAPRALVTAVEWALSADPTGRPDAATFAAAVRRAHAAAPVRLTGGPDAAAPAPELRPTHAVHREVPAAPAVAPPDRRRWWLLAGAAALLVMAGVVGWVSGRSGPDDLSAVTATAAVSPVPTPTAASAPVRWAVVLDGLDATREQVLATGAADRLAEVYVAGSEQLAADRDAVLQLRAQGRSARGVRHAVQDVQVLVADDRTARLRVRDVLAAYDLVDGSGRVVQHVAGRGERAFTVTLRRTSVGWRLASVLPV